MIFLRQPWLTAVDYVEILGCITTPPAEEKGNKNPGRLWLTPRDE